MANRTGDESEVPALKRDLDELNKTNDRKLDPFRSIFC